MADLAGQQFENYRLLRRLGQRGVAEVKILSACIAVGLLIIVLIGSYFALHSLPGSQTGGTLCLATDFPTSSSDDAAGKPTEQGADLAVSQNKNLGSGYTLEVRNFDDVSFPLGRHDPAQGARNVQQMLKTPCVVGMVGPFNSSVAAAEIPLAVNGGLTMMSPVNTNPGLTLQPYAAANEIDYAALHPAGKPNVYFRLPGNDLVQGQLDADYTSTTLRARKAFVVDDTETYGVELADFFTQEFQKQGGVILGRDSIPEVGTAGTIPAIAIKAAATHPDVVFYGGVTSAGGGELKWALVMYGHYTGPLVGGDGIVADPDFIKQAYSGAAANGTYATKPVPDLSTFTSGEQAKFLSDFRSAFATAPIPSSALAYDAAGIIIQAIRSLIQAGKAPTREAIRSAVAQMQYDGLTGHITFDQNGDNAGSKIFSIYQVQGGQWVFVQQVSV